MLPRMSHHHGHHHAHDAEAEFNEFYSQRPQTWSGNPNDALVAEATGLTPGRALEVLFIPASSAPRDSSSTCWTACAG